VIRESLLAFTLMAGANYADHATTQAGLNRGAVEVNPIMQGRLTVGKMVVVGAETGIYLALRKKSKRAAWVWVASVVMVNVGVAVRNRGVGR